MQANPKCNWTIHLPQRLCHDVHKALEHEWLVTNGLGGFASGTVAGALTRKYHGLLIAALRPPVGRQLVITKLDETALANGRKFQLYTNVWASGVEEPAGSRHLRRFDLVLGVPTWTYEFGGARLVKRIWMEHGRNATYIRYELDRSSAPIDLTCRLLVNDRPYHDVVRADERQFKVDVEGPQIEIRAVDAGVPVRMRCAGPHTRNVTWEVDYTWCRGFHLPVEQSRGHAHVEDHLIAGHCTLKLAPGAVLTFVAGVGQDANVDERDALERCTARARARLAAWGRQIGVDVATAPIPLQQLVLAADQFIVARPSPDAPDGHTVIAGYPWFTDWGRDTMISLPGLTLTTGRPEIARQILRTWAPYVANGVIPNRFPDEGTQPEYNTADATLWYLWAIDQYVRVTGDVETLAELFDVMNEIVACYRQGTVHNIHVADDGLIAAGEPGLNLTWMDAKCGDDVFTPRMGKPVELSALWYDALCNLARLADLLEKPDAEYVKLAAQTQTSFQRFWNEKTGCCYDVLDGPDGDDPAVRPNQIFAVSLSHSPLTREQRIAVVHTCERKLHTWFGLRSLAPQHKLYRGRYAGKLFERDSAYHQGTTWGFLLGPFALAHYAVHKNAAHVRAILEPMLGQLWTHGVGSLSEIFDGDEPHTPNGCIAQAWSIAETLRAWDLTQGTR